MGLSTGASCLCVFVLCSILREVHDRWLRKQARRLDVAPTKCTTTSPKLQLTRFDHFVHKMAVIEKVFKRYWKMWFVKQLGTYTEFLALVSWVWWTAVKLEVILCRLLHLLGQCALVALVSTVYLVLPTTLVDVAQPSSTRWPNLPHSTRRYSRLRALHSEIWTPPRFSLFS